MARLLKASVLLGNSSASPEIEYSRLFCVMMKRKAKSRRIEMMTLNEDEYYDNDDKEQ